MLGSRRARSLRELGRGLALPAATLTLLAAGTANATTIPGGNIVNESWTKAGNPYVIQGDITIPAGAFLHIGEGVDIQIATGDLQGSLPDAARVAIVVLGELVVSGTEAEPVHIHAQSGTSFDTWHGLVVESAATTARFTWMRLEHSRYGLDTNNAGLEVRACELAQNRYQGVELQNGAAVFDRVLVRNTYNTGIIVNGGSTTMTNVIVRDSGDYGVLLAGGTANLHSAAVHKNGSFGVYATGGSGNITNTVITNNSWGVVRSTGTVSISYSNVWGNGSSFSGSISQSNILSANPQYQNGDLGDLRLQASSVCIDAGTATGAPDHDFNNVVRPLNGDGINAAEYDIGPHEYVAAPVCGDAKLNGAEVCDDGAANGTYGFCNANCTGPGAYCGDNNLDVAHEECDDGNTTPGDGCDGQCNIESSGSGGSGGSGSGGAGSGGGGSGGNGSGGNGSGAGSSGGDGAGANDGGGGPSGPCVPGAQVSCACAGGGDGVQICADDGDGFGACSCDNNSADEGGDEGGCQLGAPTRSPRLGAIALLGAGLVLARRRRRP